MYHTVWANHHSPDPEYGFENANGIGRGFMAKDISPLRGTSGTIGAVIRGFKIGVTKWCRMHARANMVWQRNYYERVIRDEEEWNRIREYIEKNPEMWEEDVMFG